MVSPWIPASQLRSQQPSRADHVGCAVAQMPVAICTCFDLFASEMDLVVDLVGEIPDALTSQKGQPPYEAITVAVGRCDRNFGRVGGTDVLQFFERTIGRRERAG